MDLGEALTPRCARVRTVAMEPGPPPTLPVPVLAAERRSPAGLRALRRLAELAEVVVAHGSSTLPAAAMATTGGPPFVYRVIGEPGAWTTTRARRLRTTALLRQAAGIAVYHRRAADQLVALHGLDPDRVHVLPKGIDVERWRPADDEARGEARRRLGLPADAPVVAWVGALADEKRPWLAVDALAALPDAHLVVAGDGPRRGELAGLVEPLGARAHLLGAVADTRPVLAAADVLLLTSSTEGVPGAVLEAQACSVPVVAVDVGGVAEVVEDGATGRVVPDADRAALGPALVEAIAEVLPVAPALGAAARQRVVGHFRLGDVADDWVLLLQAIVHEHPR